ncbi:6-phosphofructo-2-kinase [Neocucurbitaria cava]|uniref:6-phosphofructo-2-kinase n=1 Tax=Neocucurbitaria cava TaxID=798079 RepID=A0A9W8Y6Y1_9PLEO|nr:6-phosphofructo-2-kinase [Neocucurbitaria cava]
MVGLPARGKSYIVKKLARYLNWLQFNTRIYNAGERRRTAAATQLGPQKQLSSAAFFDPGNPQCVAMRDKIALDTLDELVRWLKSEEGCVGIFDATNTTVERRRLVMSHIRKHTNPPPDVLFLESYTFDTNILQSNLRLKLSGPDYHHQKQEEALADFLQRVTHYEKSYTPVGIFEEQQKLSYVRMIDVGRKIETHLIHGFLSSQVVDYLLNFNLAERQIWLTCNGESLDDRVGRIGRNSDLSHHGSQYAATLEKFISERREAWEQDRRRKTFEADLEAKRGMRFEDRQYNRDDGKDDSCCTFEDTVPLAIWTSMMPQAIHTARPFSRQSIATKQLKMLDDLNAGDMAGLTFSEIEKLHPAVFASRQRNKLLYRWPGLGGEAYIDVINRLRAVIIELERVRFHVLLVTHRAVVRVLLGYFLGVKSDGIAAMKIPKDSLFCLEPVSYVHCHSLEHS